MPSPLLQRARALIQAGPLKQPDQRSCGAATLVFAEMLQNQEYAERMLTGGFAGEALAMHARVTGPADVAGRIQVPWPPALGTPPWAIARQLTARAGNQHSVHLVRHQSTWLTGAVSPSVIYVGSRWLPRHVALLLEVDQTGRASFYEPSRGVIVTLEKTDLEAGQGRLGGWRFAWFAISPRSAG